jgi:protein-tyrosine-phosphatase
MIWKFGKKHTTENPAPSKAFEILLVCTGNICRSPMAEGLLKHLLPAHLKQRVRVSSAGTHALHGNQAAPNAVRVMAGEGIDIRAHRARLVSREIVGGADLTLAMEMGQVKALRNLLLWKKDQVRLLSAFDPQNDSLDAPQIEDPYGGDLPEYQACFRILRPCIDGLIDWLKTHENIAPTDHR